MRLRRPTLTPSLVVSSLALFVALGGTGYAATGGNFVLGSANTADKTTSLTGTPASGAALKVTNANPGPAAAFTVNTGIAPFTVNSTTKVAKLNADKLDGIDSTGFVPVGGTAANSDTLDGIDSTGFLAAGGTAANSNLLGGISAGGFIKGTGSASGAAYAVAPNTNSPVFLVGNGWQFSYHCPATLTDPGTLSFFNNGSLGVNAFYDTPSGSAFFTLAPATGTAGIPGTPSGQFWTFQVQTNNLIGTVHIGTVNRASDCHFEAQALVTPY